MPFIQRIIEPKYLSRTSLWDEDGQPRIKDDELEAVTNCTLSNALRQLASLVLVANDIFNELGDQLRTIGGRSENLRAKIKIVEDKVAAYDPKKVTVPESDICTFALLKAHYTAKNAPETGLFTASTRPQALQALYESATKTPVHLMRQMDRWRRDGHRSSRFFLCTPILGERRRKIRTKIDIDIETRMPAAVKELRRWTSSEALGDITVTPDCVNRIQPNTTTTDGELTDGTVGSDDEGIDHKLPSPEEQLQVVALKFPAEIVAVDVSGRSFDRMSLQRRSLLHHGDGGGIVEDSIRRRTRSRRPRNRRRNTLAGTDQKEIRDALTAGEEPSSSTNNPETEPPTTTIAATTVCRSKSSDLLRSSTSPKKDSSSSSSTTTDKKSHFNTLKQWGKTRYNLFMNKTTTDNNNKKDDIDDFNIYETVTMKRKRNIDKQRSRSHERNSSISSSDKSSVNLPLSNQLSSVMNIAVKLRESSTQRRQRRSFNNNNNNNNSNNNDNNKEEPPHSSSGNWSASSESGRASIGSEFTNTTQPKSTTTTTSNNSLNQQQQQAPNSVNSRRRFNTNNTSTSSSVTSEGTLTPDIIHDLHEDGETSSVYSCDTEGYYTSFHMDSGLKTLKEEELPSTPLHSTSAFSNSSSNNTVLTAENEYELFGKGSTSTTTSSAGTVCTTLRASESNRSLGCPAVPERKSSLTKLPNKELNDDSDKTGTVKRSPATTNKSNVVAIVHKEIDGDISPDSGHNTSSSPIESTNSPNGIRSGSEFEFSESSDMEGAERIERIRIKTTINSSRIPSMCVITPPHSDDESIKSFNSFNINKTTAMDKFALNLNEDFIDNSLKSSDSDKENQNIQMRIIKTTNKVQVINVNPQSGYATVETIEEDINKNTTKTIRAPSPSGGTLTINPSPVDKLPHCQPIIKASLLPLNNVLGRIKTNLVNLRQRRDSKSPNRNHDDGDYVTLADVQNNNNKNCDDDDDDGEKVAVIKEKQQSGKIRATEYVSLDELPCNEKHSVTTTTTTTNQGNIDSLERKRRQGARVTLDAEGKVVYSSDSLRRRNDTHTTFEPGPFVKTTTTSPVQSPIPSHRIPKQIRPVTSQDNNNHHHRPLSPQLGKLIIRAMTTTTTTAGVTPSQTTSEIIRVPSSIVAAPNTRSLSPKPARGAYVHIQETMGSTQDKDRVPSPSRDPGSEMYTNYRGITYQIPATDRRYNLENQYYHHQIYQTLPTKKTQYYQIDVNQERSVTPDITRGLDRNVPIDRRPIHNSNHDTLLNQKLGIPVKIPDVSSFKPQDKVPLFGDGRNNRETYSNSNYQFAHISPPSKTIDDNNDSIRISPIDPRNNCGFQSSTPSSKTAINLETKLSSPKKSTMSNDELYAVIHKSKKKMNINDEVPTTSSSSSIVVVPETVKTVKSPETGYIGDRSKSRLSWSPSKGEYIDFNSDIDKLSPPNEMRSRQSWACSDRKGACQTSRLDFKKLLLQKSNVLTSHTKKISAVEQLKLSRQQIATPPPPPPSQSPMNILELSGSPRSLVNRKFANNQNSPRNITDNKVKAPKLLSPRSQWRFVNPRTDVLSSTILEDCREDESPNNSMEKKKADKDTSDTKNDIKRSLFSTDSIKNTSNINDIKPYLSISQKLQARRAQFFENRPLSPPRASLQNKQTEQERQNKRTIPTLETAF